MVSSWPLLQDTLFSKNKMKAGFALTERGKESFFLRFYLFIKTQRQNERQGHRQREKQAPLREPDMGLDPRSPGSRPGRKATLNC